MTARWKLGSLDAGGNEREQRYPIWDDMAVVIYEDGFSLRYGKQFHDFISRRPPPAGVPPHS